MNKKNQTFIRLVPLVICVFFTGIHANAQINKKITASFNNKRFSEFAEFAEAETKCRFYFKLADIDSLVINFDAKENTISEILTAIFHGKNLSFSIYNEQDIFIIKAEQEFLTKLPFIPVKQNKVTAVDADTDTSAPPPIQVQKSRFKTSAIQQVFEIGDKNFSSSKPLMTIAGYVVDGKSGEPVVGANINANNTGKGAITNQYGYYTLNLAKGRHTLLVSSVGMKETKLIVNVYGDGTFNIDLENFIPVLRTIVIKGERSNNVAGTQLGLQKLSIKTIKQIPMVFGEADVLRAVLSLPGVTSAGEASTGFNVRGGAANQNLILFNEATIYNPSHFFGFFSAFNPDVVKNVELYKSSIPEKYGGRLASVLDVISKDGSKKKISGSGGIGILTGRLTLEGPLKKDRTSFVLGGRSTYSNWILKNLRDENFRNSSAGFYDVNLNIAHEPKGKNKFFFTSYLSNDKFRLNKDTTFQYSNRNINLRWKRIIHERLTHVLTAGFDNYVFNNGSTKIPENSYKFSFDIRQFFVRSDFNLLYKEKHRINFGLNSIYYQLSPGKLRPADNESLVGRITIPQEQALENAVYIGDQFDVSPIFSINAGIRYSLFSSLGPGNILKYTPGVPKSDNTIIDSTKYKPGQFVKTYHGPEFRVSARLNLGKQSSVKIGYNSLRQYIHMLSNTLTISPTDIWKLSDAHIRPQLGSQVSLGFYHNTKSNDIELSAEGYYKKLKNFLDYKSSATLILNKKIEQDVLSTEGKAYGIELLIRKASGKLNGWVSYTYSRSLLQTKDSTQGELINKGELYPADFDRPHIVNFIGNYKVSHRVSFSVNMNFSTGRPITLPIAIYNYAGGQRVLYSKRNEFRIPNYFRTDFSMNFEGNHKIKKLAHSSLSIGLYNLTGRKNPFSVYFNSEFGRIKGYQLSIFGTIIPFVTYNFKF
jgi:CarboxypepD_reg-like domain/TonB-dependent Receptor Plug Domain